MKRLGMFLLSLFFLSLHTHAQQATNLLRNPDAAEGAQHWWAHGNATVEEFNGEGRTFTLRDGGYFIQDATLPEGAAGQYALLVGQALCENCSDEANAKMAYISGAMMNPGTTYEGGRAYGSASAPSLSYPRAGRGWQRLWGVARIPAGTGKIRFNIWQGNGVTRYRGLGLYVFPTQQEARAFADGQLSAVAPVAVSEATEAKKALPAPSAPQCVGTSLKTLTIAGLRLGMSVEEALESLPGSGADAGVRRMLEKSRASNEHGYSHAMIDAAYARDPTLSGVEKYWVKFLDGRLFAVQVVYRGANWPSAEAFIKGMSGALALPPVESWERVSGIDSRYIICDDVELRFYAAPGVNPNADSILLAERKAERLLAERKTKAQASR